MGGSGYWRASIDICFPPERMMSTQAAGDEFKAFSRQQELSLLKRFQFSPPWDSWPCAYEIIFYLCLRVRAARALLDSSSSCAAVKRERVFLMMSLRLLSGGSSP